MTEYYAGVMPGLGQSSALVLVRLEAGDTERYHVLSAKIGAPLLSYREQALALAWMLEEQSGDTGHIHLNLTGGGQPLKDLFRAPLDQRRTSLTGYKVVEDESYDRTVSPPIVGKQYLLTRLITLIEADGLRLPDTTEGQRVRQALAAMTRSANPLPAGEDGLLVLALGLAVCESHASVQRILAQMRERVRLQQAHWHRDPWRTF